MQQSIEFKAFTKTLIVWPGFDTYKTKLSEPYLNKWIGVAVNTKT